MIVIDEYSQNEIISFWRGRHLYFYLRDPKRKTFIKRLNKLYICYIAVFERCYSGRERKGRGKTRENDIHVEFLRCEEVDVFDNPRAEEDIEDIKASLETEADFCAMEYGNFGGNGWDKTQFVFATKQIYEEVPCLNDRCKGDLPDVKID